MKQYDVVVVGGGPAGLSSARTSALNGAKTLVIDKKEEIGVPVQCAEGIGSYLIESLPFQIPKDQLIWKIDGMYFWSDNISIERTDNWWKGYTIDRKKFDKWLSVLAQNAGADLWTNAKLVDMEFDTEYDVTKVTVKHKEKLLDIAPKAVIAADGAESKILQLLGLYAPKAGDIAQVYSWELTNLNLNKPHFEQIYLGEFSPHGYAYIFPKSKKSANFGIGNIYSKENFEKYFYEFLEIEPVKKQIKNATFTVEKSGKASIGHIVDRWVYGNILLVGDCANQNLKPFVEGVLPSIICGDIAGSFASSRGLKKNIDTHSYKNIVENTLHPHFSESNKMIDVLKNIYAMRDNKKHLLFCGFASGAFEAEKLLQLKKLSYTEIWNLLQKSSELE